MTLEIFFATTANSAHIADYKLLFYSHYERVRDELVRLLLI